MIPARERIGRFWLLAAIIVLLAGCILTYTTRHEEDNPYKDLQVEAATIMRDAEAYMKEEILERGIAIEAEDLNQTGLLGPEFTQLTTTPGNIDAKRTSLSPDFAALLVRYYVQAGLEEGDVIAIGSSGSFPGLLVASLAAGQAMGLEMRVIASLGASMHGATRPEYNIFDFINAMDEGGFADFDLVGVSAGGPNDQGGGLMDGILWFDTAQLSLDLCAETGAHLIYHDSLEDSIQERLELYGDDVDLFVSIGGASPNCGTSSYTLNFPNGLVTNPPTIPTTPERGLNYEYAARGVPVVNLLNVRGLANDNGMTYDPVPFDEIGESGVYKETEYNIWIVVVTLAAAFAILIIGWKRGREAR